MNIMTKVKNIGKSVLLLVQKTLCDLISIRCPILFLRGSGNDYCVIVTSFTVPFVAALVCSVVMKFCSIKMRHLLLWLFLITTVASIIVLIRFVDHLLRTSKAAKRDRKNDFFVVRDGYRVNVITMNTAVDALKEKYNVTNWREALDVSLKFKDDIGNDVLKLDPGRYVCLTHEFVYNILMEQAKKHPDEITINVDERVIMKSWLYTIKQKLREMIPEDHKADDWTLHDPLFRPLSEPVKIHFVTIDVHAKDSP